MESIMIECTLDVLENMDQYSDDTEFFAYKVSRKDGDSFLYSDPSIFENKKLSLWHGSNSEIDEDQKNFIPLKHEVGAKFEVPNANSKVAQPCAPGINVGTLNFLREFVPQYKHKNYKDINGPYNLSVGLGGLSTEHFITLWKVKFTKKDIACLPTEYVWGYSNPQPAEKFRLFRCEVIEELPLSLLEVPKEKVVIDDPVAAA
jgi:hypothetical protein